MASDKKNEILAAAGKCFVRFGYDKTTLDDIGEMVGMNKVSLYYYFKNKDAIFTEVITREADEYSEAMKKNVETLSGCREKILAWIEEGFKYNQGNSILRQLSFETLKSLRPQLEELKEYAKKKGTEYLASILKDCKTRGEITDCDVNMAAEAIHNVIYALKDNAYMRSKSNLNNEADFSGMVKEILFTVSLILDGIIIKK